MMLCFRPLLLLNCYSFHLLMSNSMFVVAESRLAPASESYDDDYSSIAPPVSSSNISAQPTFVVLAPRRTYRKDPLNGFRTYTAGWNITNRHYWASVGYSAAPFFITSMAWFLVFIAIASISCFSRCPNMAATSIYALSLIAPLLFSILAIIGCVVMHTGLAKFHRTITNTLEYVVGHADATSHNPPNTSAYLLAAKQISVHQVSLPPGTKAQIDQTQIKMDSSATAVVHTATTSDYIINLMRSLRVALIVLTLIMLLLMFLGLVFPILGMQSPVYLLVVTVWILVTGALILAGIFLLLHNATGDTCVAMNQWVQMNSIPDAATELHTALDDVIECVDNATVQKDMSITKQVTFQLVNLVNTVITNVSNINFSPNFTSVYFNQSGPLMPTLCNPFQSDLTDRACAPNEVDLNDATQAWSGYVCQTMPLPSGNTNGICISTGRLTPTLYDQMAATVNVSNGLYQYGLIMAQFKDCSSMREAFSYVNTMYCPALTKYSQRVYVGLGMASAATMLSIVFWVMVLLSKIKV